MKQLTHKQASANGGKQRAINLRKKLGEKGYRDLMTTLSHRRKRGVDKPLAKELP